MGPGLYFKMGGTCHSWYLGDEGMYNFLGCLIKRGKIMCRREQIYRVCAQLLPPKNERILTGT